MTTQRAFRTDIPDTNSFVTASGTRFGMKNGHIITDDPEIIATLRGIAKSKIIYVEEISPDDVPTETAAEEKQSRNPADLGEGTTISPEDLRARIAATQASKPATAGITSTTSIAKNTAVSDTKK